MARPITIRPSVASAPQILADSTEGALVQDLVPADEAPPEAWAEYVQKAYGRAASAVIEVGKRINKAHAAYMAQGQTWGRTWEEWCQTNLGYRATNAYKRMKIAESLSQCDTNLLPPDTESLYALARINQRVPRVFNELVQAGKIRPTLTREQVKTITVEAMPAGKSKRTKALRGAAKPRSIRLPKDLQDALANKGDDWQEWACQVLREALMRQD